MDHKQAALELGTKPVGQLLWQYALPAIVAMSASGRKLLRAWVSPSRL